MIKTLKKYLNLAQLTSGGTKYFQRGGGGEMVQLSLRCSTISGPSIKYLSNQSVNQSINQLINQSISQSIVSQSFNQSKLQINK